MTTAAVSPGVAFVTTSVADGIAEWARVALATGRGRLSATERQRLKDVQRPDRRYGFQLIEQLCAIAERAPDPAIRYGLAEIIRLRCTPPKTATTALPSCDALEEQETVQEGRTNISQLRRHCERSAAARDALIADLLREEECTRALRERVEAEAKT